jgi:hypothetical protein
VRLAAKLVTAAPARLANDLNRTRRDRARGPAIRG